MQHNDLQDALAYLRTLFSTYESQGVQITGSRMPFTQYANFAAMKYLLFLANQDRYGYGNRVYQCLPGTVCNNSSYGTLFAAVFHLLFRCSRCLACCVSGVGAC